MPAGRLALSLQPCLADRRHASCSCSELGQLWESRLRNHSSTSKGHRHSHTGDHPGIRPLDQGEQQAGKRASSRDLRWPWLSQR